MSNEHIVITGSTRGIGYGLAKAFLSLGCSLTISGRSKDTVDHAVERLSSQFEKDRIFGMVSDVVNIDQVQALWDRSIKKFGKVDIWVNNAGLSGNQGRLWELSAEDIDLPIRTNILGTIYGSQVAVQGMLAQGSGAIYNMEGMGSDGRKHAGLTCYGTSKYAVHYFTESLALELKDTPVLVAALRPGMVITDLVVDQFEGRPEEWQRAKKIFNIIADSVENVSVWTAKKVLANKKNGVTLAYSSNAKMLWRLISQPFVRRNLFQNE